SSTNNRGKSLFEFLISNNFLVFNRGSEPTFVTSRYRTIIDLTFGTTEVAKFIDNWRVSNEISDSDHRYITFTLDNVGPVTKSYRNPRKTDWCTFKDTLSVCLEPEITKVRTNLDLDLAAENLRDSLIESFQKACPEGRTQGL